MIQLTKNQVMEGCLIVLNAGSLESLGNLLFSVTSGRYGWNTNIYFSGEFDVAVVNGDKAFGNFELSREELKKWDDRADGILSQKGRTGEEKYRAIYNLRYDFYKYVREEYFKKLKAERELKNGI